MNYINTISLIYYLNSNRNLYFSKDERGMWKIRIDKTIKISVFFGIKKLLNLWKWGVIKSGGFNINSMLMLTYF